MGDGEGFPDPQEDCSYEDGDDAIARFLLEADVCSEEDDYEEELAQPCKKRRVEDELPSCIESGEFGKIPPDLFRNILKFLCSEDLSSCAKVCQYLRRAASEAPLWRRLYSLRWGSTLTSQNSFNSEWKQLYFERDRADVAASMENAPPEFKEYYMQMQVAKRTEAPLPSHIKDEVVDQSIAAQVTAWRHSRKLAENYIGDHKCSGKTCTYHQIGDVYICEKTGCAHVCGDACRELVLDTDYIHVCMVSGRCFDPCLFEEEVIEEEETEPQQAAAADEAEPWSGGGRLARLYSLGYHGYKFEKVLRCY